MGAGLTIVVVLLCVSTIASVASTVMLAMLFWGLPRPRDPASSALGWADNPHDRRMRARWENHDRKLAGINRRVRYLDDHGTKSAATRPGKLKRRLVREDAPR